MAWGRFGDTLATYPKILQIIGFRGADDRAINEATGFLVRCAAQSASHTTDYVIDPGTVQMLAGSPARAKVLIAWSLKAGLITPIKVGSATHWLLIGDPDFIHIRTQAELDAESQKRSDVADTGITVPVRLRDGDNCRYCGRQVMWTGRKSNRSAELDHVDYGAAPATIDTLVVACRRCNGARKNTPEWDLTHPRRQAPTAPNYGDVTVAFLARNGVSIEANIEPDATRAGYVDNADDWPRPAADTAASQQRPATETAVSRPRPTSPPETTSGDIPETRPPPGWAVDPGDGKPDPKPDQNSVSDSFGTGSAGSGREGTAARKRRRKRRGSTPTEPCCAKPFLQPDPETGITTCLTCEKGAKT